MRRRILTCIASGLVGASILAGVSACVDTADGPLPSSSTSSGASSSASIPAKYDASLGAKGNQPLFDAVLSPLWKNGTLPTTAQITSALTDVGFKASQMQFSQDKTPEGRKPDSKIVGLKIGGKCLLGQYVQGYRSEIVAPVYGKCLIGGSASAD